MSGWENFFVAEVGASAALAGLLFVSVSVNLTRILALPGLPGRAGMTLIVLGQVLLISTCLLVPGQRAALAGAETLAISAVAWAAIVVIETHMPRPEYAGVRRDVALRWALSQLATWPFIVAGLVLLTGRAGGLDWTVPGVLFSFVYVFIQAWVLLVEINR